MVLRIPEQPFTELMQMATLVDYLKGLNSADSQWGLWVNPENADEYRVGQFCFDNGGVDDNWVCIGTLENLSFGFQSERDAFACWVSHGIETERMPRENQKIEYRGKPVVVNPEALYEAWSDGRCDEEFAAFIQDEIDLIVSEWADWDAEDFVDNKLPAIIKAKAEAIC